MKSRGICGEQQHGHHEIALTALLDAIAAMHKSKETSRKQRRVSSIAKESLRSLSSRGPRHRDHRHHRADDQ